MIRYREVLPASLTHALLANRMVSALGQAQRDQQSVDEQVIGEGILFLQTVLQGREFTKSLSLSEDAYQAALAYGEAIPAIEALSGQINQNINVPGRDPDRIDHILRSLLGIAEDVRDKRDVGPDALRVLDLFFTIVAESAMASRKPRVEKVEYDY